MELYIILFSFLLRIIPCRFYFKIIKLIQVFFIKVFKHFINLFVKIFVRLLSPVFFRPFCLFSIIFNFFSVITKFIILFTL